MPSPLLEKSRKQKKRKTKPKSRTRTPSAPKKSNPQTKPLSLRIKKNLILIVLWMVPLIGILIFTTEKTTPTLDKYQNQPQQSQPQKQNVFEELYQQKAKGDTPSNPLYYDDELPETTDELDNQYNQKDNSARNPWEEEWDRETQMYTGRKASEPITNQPSVFQESNTEENQSTSPVDDNLLETGSVLEDDASTTMEHENQPMEDSPQTRKLFFFEMEGAKVRLIPLLINAGQASSKETLIRLLLSGPNEAQKQIGLTSAIPEGTQLLDLSISNHIARINLNQSFQKQQYGLIGAKLAVGQLVYSLCEYPDVQQVEFRIEGREVMYLGGDEGIPSKRFDRGDLPMELSF
jgi:spore germination protein GerM